MTLQPLKPSKNDFSDGLLSSVIPTVAHDNVSGGGTLTNLTINDTWRKFVIGIIESELCYAKSLMSQSDRDQFEPMFDDLIDDFNN